MLSTNKIVIFLIFRIITILQKMSTPLLLLPQLLSHIVHTFHQHKYTSHQQQLDHSLSKSYRGKMHWKMSKKENQRPLKIFFYAVESKQTLLVQEALKSNTLTIVGSDIPCTESFIENFLKENQRLSVPGSRFCHKSLKCVAIVFLCVVLFQECI